MHFIDWILIGVPLVFVVWGGLRTQRYVKGVADFLTAGRVAGRYVLSVSSGEAGMGLISLVAVYESYYQSGFAYGFWGSLAAPISIILGLTGYCTYRFRETRAMTVGQFLEIRYSRRFRNFAGVLQSTWGSILVQDVILPFRKKPFTPKQQLLLLRILIASVATFAFFFSYFFGQVDYILMFFAITGAIWLGGSGPCIVGGLYWKRGTTAGAWVAMICGSILAVAAILVQKLWVPDIYPWLHAHGMVEPLAAWLERCSAPFEPIIKWRMSSDRFPINSQEVYGITMLISIGLYVVVSLLTSTRGRVFNMDRMLHRGQYHREGIRSEKPRLTWRTLYAYLLGIDNQYSRGDRILAWSVFIWSFGWGFLCCFVGVATWNFISPWGNVGWSRWFFFNNFILAGVIATASTVWFMFGGIRDLRRLFRDLKLKDTNVLDDGRVVDHVSADDVPLVEQVEQNGNDNE